MNHCEPVPSTNALVRVNHSDVYSSRAGAAVAGFFPTHGTRQMVMGASCCGGACNVCAHEIAIRDILELQKVLASQIF
jgi:hypothetical protein